MFPDVPDQAPAPILICRASAPLAGLPRAITASGALALQFLSRTPHQFPAAIRAHRIHRGGAFLAERALVTADVRLILRLQRSLAFLALGFHL
jgi:hypothetical protein